MPEEFLDIIRHIAKTEIVRIDWKYARILIGVKLKEIIEICNEKIISEQNSRKNSSTPSLSPYNNDYYSLITPEKLEEQQNEFIAQLFTFPGFIFTSYIFYY
jgi:hypothetical protein